MIMIMLYQPRLTRLIAKFLMVLLNACTHEIATIL